LTIFLLNAGKMGFPDAAAVHLDGLVNQPEVDSRVIPGCSKMFPAAEEFVAAIHNHDNVEGLQCIADAALPRRRPPCPWSEFRSFSVTPNTSFIHRNPSPSWVR
jgi:hypothetical protein